MNNDLVAFLKVIKKFLDLENIENYVTDYVIDEGSSIKVLEASTLFKQDHELAGELEELELSISYFILDDEGLVNNQVKNILSKHNINIVKLNNDRTKGSYYLNCGKFNLIFSID